MPTPPPPPPPGSQRLKLVNLFTAATSAAYRRSGGRLGGRFKGTPVLLLEHVGRRSGQERTTPLVYMEDGDDLIIVASRGGSDSTPAWWLNLKASPQTTVQIGRERRQVVARQVSAEDKAELWPRIVEMNSDFAVYESRTTRDIPVIALSPAGASAS